MIKSLGLGTMPSAKRALIVVENNSVPFDRRVWREALSLRDAGWQVGVICPRKDSDNQLVVSSSRGHFETLEGVRIYRYPFREAGLSSLSYLLEYGSAFLETLRLTFHVARSDGFD